MFGSGVDVELIVNFEAPFPVLNDSLRKEVKIVNDDECNHAVFVKSVRKFFKMTSK